MCKKKVWYPKLVDDLKITRRIPMTPTDNTIVEQLASQESFEQMVKARLREAVRIALVSVLEGFCQNSE